MHTDYEFYFLLKMAEWQTSCTDKRVAALAKKEGNPLQIAWNKCCSPNCNHCDALHAERQISLIDADIYLTLFPCEECQVYLASLTPKSVTVYTNAPHKKDLEILPLHIIPDPVEGLRTFNGEQNQKLVALGELAELSTEICNTFRVDSRRTDVIQEVVDVQLQLFELVRMYKSKPMNLEAQLKVSGLVNKFEGVW
jgi:hypothetical protein